MHSLDFFPLGLTAVVLALGAILAMSAWASLAVVVVGNIGYYSILHAIGLTPSAILTGSVYGGLGLLAAARVVTRGDLRASRLPLLLFTGFVALWYLRWNQEPPSILGGGFAERAQVFMIAFAAVPFVAGCTLRGLHDMREMVTWLARLGLLQGLLILWFWFSGAPSQSPWWSSQWLPVPHLNGITLTFDLGTSCVAFFCLTQSRGGWSSWLLRLAVAFATIAIGVRVGERGPLVFLLPAIAVGILLSQATSLSKRAALAAAGLITAGAFALAIADAYGAYRAVTLENYKFGSNADRVDILRHAAELVAQRPFAGWGGGLVGLRLRTGEPWQYSHVWLLDSLVETGLAGAALHWSLVALVVFRLASLWRLEGEPRECVRMLFPLLVYTFLENQVSGHISTSRHLWLILGAACASLSTTRAPAPAPSG